MTIYDRHPIARTENIDRIRANRIPGNLPKEFVGFSRHFFFLTGNVWNHVLLDIQRRNSWVARARKGLKRSHYYFSYRIGIIQRFETHCESDTSAIGCRKDKSELLIQSPFYQFQMVGVYLWNKKRNVRIHPMG